MVPVKEIEEKDFDLSINRYKEATHEELSFEPPKKIIARLRGLEEESRRNFRAGGHAVISAAPGGKDPRGVRASFFLGAHRARPIPLSGFVTSLGSARRI